MIQIIRVCIMVAVLLLTLSSCEFNDPEYPYVPSCRPTDTSIYNEHPLWQRHHNSSHKILAIGNSFTMNATSYIPWLINSLNSDSICIARLIQSGCSLEQHWKSHINDTPDYNFYYSDHGNWKFTDIKTIDDALCILDWDIIVIQQVSGLAGLYETYQPYLDNLVRLFHDTNPNAMLAWHYTWAYTSWTKHSDFKYYDKDPEKMYAAILYAGDRASINFDLRIPSATLIKLMREEYPEVENGFTEDGYHIVDDFAQYALSSLWYEVLVGAFTATSSLEVDLLPSLYSPDVMDRTNEIIRNILE